MPDRLSWDDAEEIAEVLRQRFPDTSPEEVSALEIARWAREIPMLEDTPGPPEALAAQIEAIRAAWMRP